MARPLRPVKQQVFKLLKRRDVTSDLLEETVHIVWPDNGAWYAATVKQVRHLARRLAMRILTEPDVDIVRWHYVSSDLLKESIGRCVARQWRLASGHH